MIHFSLFNLDLFLYDVTNAAAAESVELDTDFGRHITVHSQQLTYEIRVSPKNRNGCLTGPRLEGAQEISVSMLCGPSMIDVVNYKCGNPVGSV